MILGLSHIALTVSALDESIKYYRENFGFTVLSDAERKGEWVDKITGIPGFHTRTVYLSVTPYRHMEVFGFFNPKTILPEKDAGLHVGILYCAFMGGGEKSFSPFEVSAEKQKGSKQLGDIGEGPYPGRRVSTWRDPDGLLLKIIEPENEERVDQKGATKEFLYPGMVVENIGESILFYRDVLGLGIADQGGPSLEKNSPAKDGLQSSVRWVLLRAQAGSCLKLVQPVNFKILPAAPWKMQRVGFTHVAFGVKNLEEFYLELTKRNVNFKAPPQSIIAGPHQGGKAVYLTTPEGLTLEFIDSPLIQEEGKSWSGSLCGESF